MMPAQEDDIDLVEWRINSWKNRIAPEGYAFPGDPRNWEQEKYETAKLTKLGKKNSRSRKMVVSDQLNKKTFSHFYEKVF
jgi:hypothetical protein